MKLEFKNFQGKIDPKDLSKKVCSFVVRKEFFVLGVVALILIGYCGYLWYKYNYNYQWSDAEKQAYVLSKKTGVGFEKDKFEEVLKDINMRREKYKEELKVGADIFRLKK